MLKEFPLTDFLILLWQNPQLNLKVEYIDFFYCLSILDDRAESASFQGYNSSCHHEKAVCLPLCQIHWLFKTPISSHDLF